MRFLYGILAYIIWSIFLCALGSYGCDISTDTQVLTLAIVVAGALAGGDG